LAEARIAQAQHEVSLARLVAPFGGALVRRLRSSGDRVAPGETVWELVDTSAREVIVDLPASIAAQLAREGCSVLEPKSGASAQVQTIVLAEAAEATTRNVRAWLRLAAEADARLAPGVAVDVTLPWRPLTGAWLVPNDALRRTEQGTLIVTANATSEAGLKAAFVPVKVLGTAGGKTAIEAQGTPLTAGLKVVVVGVEMAFPDAPLMPRN
jgi:hypothetical protein